MSHRRRHRISVNEQSTKNYRATLTDQITGLPPTLIGLELTLYDLDTDAILNSRDGANVLNSGGGTYNTSTGLLIMTLSANDNVIQDATKARERHRALFEATWSGGAHRWEVDVLVTNLHRVP